MVGKNSKRKNRRMQPMPAFIRRALMNDKLLEAYQRRPPYQRIEYVDWITRVKVPQAQRNRLEQMLDELASGNRYMKMQYPPENMAQSPNR